MNPFGQTLAQLRAGYSNGDTTPSDVIRDVLARIERTRDDHAWITVAEPGALLARAAELEHRAEADGIGRLPLYGVPIAVKDNIDVAGLPTTNACPEFAHVPEESATAVQRVLDAGAIVVGKTNLDQFATGLVGVRSPYGIPRSVFGKDIVSGGSSSGSAVAVASGVVPIALATDTAGSGRVPAALNGVIGVKPTLGLVSTRGLEPACRTIDGITVMATGIQDALTLLEVIVGHDPKNPWGRVPATLGASTWQEGMPLRLGLPESLDFFGDTAMQAAHLKARTQAMDSLGATGVSVDLTPFLDAGALLYQGAWVAERYADLGPFLETHPDSPASSINPIVRRIIESGQRFSAADLFRTQHALRTLRHAVRPVWDQVDALVLPTIGTTFTIEEVLADPIARNSVLGHYTHFANLLDLAAIAIPAGLTEDGRPASLMLIGPPRSDLTLATIAQAVLG